MTARAHPYFWAYTRTALVGGVRRPVGRLVCFLQMLNPINPWLASKEKNPVMKSVYTCNGCGAQVAIALAPTEPPPWWIELYTVRAVGPRAPGAQTIQTDSAIEHLCSVACLVLAARDRFAALLEDVAGKGDADPLDKPILSGVRVERRQLEPPMMQRIKP